MTASQYLNNVENSSGVPALYNLGRLKISNIVDLVIPFVFGAALILVFVYLIMGGFAILTSHGDPKAMEGAKAKITYALLGFVIIFTAYWLVQLLGLATSTNFGSIPQ